MPDSTVPFAEQRYSADPLVYRFVLAHNPVDKGAAPWGTRDPERTGLALPTPFKPHVPFAEQADLAAKVALSEWLLSIAEGDGGIGLLMLESARAGVELPTDGAESGGE